MSYRDLTRGDLQLGKVCTQDGNFVADTAQHDAHHRYLQERTSSGEEVAQLRKELAAADEKAQGYAERAAAAIRLAEAVWNHRFNPGTDDAAYHELNTALELWGRLRED